MIITDSAIQLYSRRTFIEQHTKRESLTVWQTEREPKVFRADRHKGRELDPAKELADLSQDTVRLSRHDGMKRRQMRPADLEITKEQKMEADLNMRLLQALFERLTGRKFQVIDPVKITTPLEGELQAGESAVPLPEAESAGFGLIYEYRESEYEYEKTEFAAGGKINTADGRQIDFSVSLSMSREFYREQNLSIRAGDALKDPLVINFSGSAAQLTERNFSFDIDADGTKDQIAFVGPGSGFLALDKNGDGIVNDGSELFGALSGDGFLDLRAYDGDGNNWIDENDAIYENLRIWSRTGDGEEQLVGLGQAGVGALYLGHIETLFSVKDAENSLLGQVRSTGLALMENGQAVTMQQFDLVA
ncbi:MAG: hypothetical protein VR65_13210 [Desulfobulbaceae bacterium BRH_c16a]|nr:MAG: hypothetical protein VR65_13210 [Desulfobulbaceae bacterium BRH_c16a]